MTTKTHAIFESEVMPKLAEGSIFLDRYSGAKYKLRLQCPNGHIRNITPTNMLSRGNGLVCHECTGGQLFNNSKRWSKEEIEYLILKHIDTPTQEMSEKLGRSYAGVANKCKELGLLKEFKATNALTLEEVNTKVTKLFPHLRVLTYALATGDSEILDTRCQHTWLAKTGNILTEHSGYTCRTCNPSGVSEDEKALVEFIKSKYSGWIIENDRHCIAPLELDIVLPDLGLAIEYNGVYFHSEEYKPPNYHLNKSNTLYKNMGYRLIHINSDEWLTKKAIVKSRLSSVLGCVDRREYARNCTVKEICYPKAFLMANHLQGSGSPTSINLGLFKGEELLSVMTFSKPRFNTDRVYELVRFCSLLNTTVIGGASKLLQYFRNKYPGGLVSYSDKRWSEGNLYKKLGFTLSHTSTPNYRYYKNTKSLSRYQCQKHKLKDLFPELFSASKTEAEIMKEAGYYRVYDCGNDVWVMP